MKTAEQLAEEHWGYVKAVLIHHGESQRTIGLIGFHYREAAVHFYKHGKDITGENKMLECNKCEFKHYNESDAALHHIVPRVLGGRDKDERKYLCGVMKGNDCHRKLHSFLAKDDEIKELLKRKYEEWLISQKD